MNDGLQEIDIQPADRIAFVHIPKSAGETFSVLVDPLLSGFPRFPKESLETGARLTPEDVAGYQLFMSHVSHDSFNALLPDGFLMMTVLRDPVRRTISHYHHLHRLGESTGSPERDAELRRIREMTLEEFVADDEMSEARIVVNLQTWMLGGVDPRIGLRFPDRGDLALAKQRLERAAFFGLTERFQDSLFLLSFIFGWPPIVNSLELNRAPASGRPAALDPGTISLIEKKVGLDLELYEFARQLFERRFRAMTRRLTRAYGNGGHPDTQPSVPAETLVDLLQQHYEARRDHRRRAWVRDRGASYVHRPSSVSEGAFGWYSLEFVSKHGEVRWSGPGLHAGFDLPCPRGPEVRISFRVLMALQPDILDGLKLTANGAPTTLTRVKDTDGAAVFSGTIPAEATTEPFVRLVFSVPRTVTPRSVLPDNLDERQLGILLNWVKLEGVGDTSHAAGTGSPPADHL